MTKGHALNNNIKKQLKNYQNIEAMLDDIPPQLWDFFLPEDPNDLYKLELKIIALKKTEHERKQVMAIQNRYGFPLRPNVTLHEVIVKVKILRLKLERQNRPRKDFDN